LRYPRIASPASFASPRSAAIFLSAALASCLSTLSTLGCAGVKQQSTTGTAGTTGSAGTSGGGNQTGTGGTSVVTPQPCNGPGGKCTDFEPPTTPMNPMFATGVQTTDAGKFGTPSGTGPCVSEPETGTLFPNNWLRPRVRVPGNTGVMKITFHADMETMDLVVYASGEHWELPKDIWTALASHIVNQDISVSVQLPSGGLTTVTFQVAPVGAGGSMVFWSMDPSQVGKMAVESMAQSAVANDSYLDGFAVGDDTTISLSTNKPALSILDVKQQVTKQDGSTQGSHCIGCHTGTPDGDYVAFVDSWPWGAAFAGIKPGIVGNALPSYEGASCTNWNTCTPLVTGSARTYLQYPWLGGFAFSRAHWGSGDRIGIVAAQLASTDVYTPWNGDNKLPGNLVWIDTLSNAITMNNGQPFPTPGTAFGYMQHTGDLGGVAFPTWSNDGNTIVYASSSGSTADQDGRLNQGPTDLYSVPYNNKSGGAATAVPGASTTGYEEYYPAFSPNDKLLAFTRVPAGQVMYANPNAEVFVVPFGAAGTATRLAANDSHTMNCPSGPAAVNNHWPKWSPDATVSGARTYYWIIFSSNRYGLPTVTTNFGGTSMVVELSQLYMTAVVTDEVNTYSYPAVYLWNQPQTRLNTTPAWQDFHIPIVVD
jgi:hypothetical protein